MKHRYRISPEGRGTEPTDSELLRYKDGGRLLYNYQKAASLLHRRPIYRDPRAFLVLLVIVLLAWLISEAGPGPKAPEEDTTTAAPAQP